MAEADGLCSLVLREPCQWEGALYSAVGPVAPVPVTSVLSANETVAAWEAVGAYFNWSPPPPPPSPPPAPPAVPPPAANGTAAGASGAPPSGGQQAAGAPPPPPQPYTGQPIVTIGRRLQALAQRLGSLFGGSSSSGSNSGSGASSSSGRKLQQELLQAEAYTFDPMSGGWAGAQLLSAPGMTRAVQVGTGRLPVQTAGMRAWPCHTSGALRRPSRGVFFSLADAAGGQGYSVENESTFLYPAGLELAGPTQALLTSLSLCFCFSCRPGVSGGPHSGPRPAGPRSAHRCGPSAPGG